MIEAFGIYVAEFCVFLAVAGWLAIILVERHYSMALDVKPKQPDPSFVRSMQLLNKWLSPLQRKQFKLTKNFDVTGGVTGKRYCIDGSERKPYNITEYDDAGKPIAKWCIVTNDFRLPLGDVLLMQKLSLEADECEALRIANKNGMYFYGITPEPIGECPY